MTDHTVVRTEKGKRYNAAGEVVIFASQEEINACGKDYRARKREAISFKQNDKAQLFNNLLGEMKGKGAFKLGDVQNAMDFKRTTVSKFSLSVMPKTLKKLQKAETVVAPINVLPQAKPGWDPIVDRVMP